MAKGQVLRAQGRFEEAIPEYETVIELNRNAAYAISALGQCKFFTGSVEEAIPLQQRFIRLSPRDPLIGGAYLRIGVVHLLQSRTEEAIVWFEKAAPLLPDRSITSTSPPPMPSAATWTAPPPSSPKPEG